jgi:hypothetical protein
MACTKAAPAVTWKGISQQPFFALVACVIKHYGYAGQCHYFSISARPGIYRRYAVCAILFWLPLAMVILCITFVPVFSKLKVFTPYEFLEQRFNIKTRTFTAALFLLSRGFSTASACMHLQLFFLPCLVGIYFTPISSWAGY